MSAQPTRAGVRYAVREAKDVAGTKWDRWLRGSPGGGHVHQSYAWGEFKRTLGWEPVYLVLERNDEVVGLGLFLSYNTLPVPGRLWYCTKGPWLPYDDEEAVRAFFEGVRVAARRAGVHTVKIEPELPEERADMKALITSAGFRKARWDLNQRATMVVDLSPPEVEVLGNMRGETRRSIRASAKKGVEVVEPPFEEAFEAFYRLFHVTAERTGLTIRRSREYLGDLMRSMIEADQGRFFVARHEGEPLAVAYVFAFGEKLWYIFGASGNEKRNLRPTYLLQWEAMRWARERGITYYDMVGVPRPGNLDESDPLWGVYKFKSGFGGEVTEFVGCYDLPVRPALAAAWYKAEPFYYRAYYKLKNNVFY